MKRNIFIISALLVVLLFAACSDVLQPGGGSSSDGILDLIVGDEGAARTLAPTVSGLKYKVVVRDLPLYGPVYTSGTVRLTNDNFPAAGDKVKLQPGTYVIVAEAYNAANVLVAASYQSGPGTISTTPDYEARTVTIASGQTSAVYLPLFPVYNSDLPGTFAWDITLPAESDIPLSEATLQISVSTDPNTTGYTYNLLTTPENKAGTVALPGGVYTVNLNLTSTRQVSNFALSVNKKEVVYIYPGSTTTMPTVAFTAADFTAKVRLGGRVSINTMISTARTYEPKEVEIRKADGSTLAVPITKDTADGTWGWQALLDSQDIPRQNASTINANVSQIPIRFSAKLVGYSNTVYTPWKNVDINRQGNDDILLTMQVTYFNRYAQAPDVEFVPDADITFSNNDVVLGDSTTVTIKPPSSHGVIGSWSRYQGPYIYDRVTDYTYAGSASLSASGSDVTVNVGVPIEAEYPVVRFTIARPWARLEVPAGYNSVTVKLYNVDTGALYSTSSWSVPVDTSDNVYILRFGSPAIIPEKYIVEAFVTGTGGINNLYAQWLSRSLDQYEYYQYYDPPTYTVFHDESGYGYLGRFSLQYDGWNSYDPYISNSNFSQSANNQNQSAPATFTAVPHTDNGFLSSVTLTWASASGATSYQIERSIHNPGDAPYFVSMSDNFVTISGGSTTSIIDDTHDLPAVSFLGQQVLYRIRARTTSSTVPTYYSTWVMANTITPPSATVLTEIGGLDNATAGSITTSAQKKVYIIDESFYGKLNSDYNLYGYDSENLPGRNFTDVQFIAYDSYTKAAVGTYDYTNGTRITLPNSTANWVNNYVIVVVQPAKAGDTGNFAIRYGW